MTSLERARRLNDRPVSETGPVIYWMQRDMRVRDNWALLYAEGEAHRLNTPLLVCFVVAPSFLGATLRAYDFLLGGLQEVEQALRRLNVPLLVLEGEPPRQIDELAARLHPALLVTDFNPLRHVQAWKADVAAHLPCSMVEVDAHNIVPAWIASDHQEWSAATLRRKLGRLVQAWLTEIPAPSAVPKAPLPPLMDWAALRSRLSCDKTVLPVEWCIPGTRAGMKRVSEFCGGTLSQYAAEHNDPNLPGASRLSPWLHFGQISAQRVALEVQRSGAPAEAIQTFLEQLIVRRELADNWCLYNSHYDSAAGFPDWARRTLAIHAADPRAHLYTREELDAAKTHDPLWNAAQRRLRDQGYLHGYLRIYWAKQVLLWKPSAAEALADILWLNDRYELDGRDPNGYVGAAWSIGGVHDRPWPQRPVFGSVRSMTLTGARGKFDVEKYVSETQD